MAPRTGIVRHVDIVRCALLHRIYSPPGCHSNRQVLLPFFFSLSSRRSRVNQVVDFPQQSWELAGYYVMVAGASYLLFIPLRIAPCYPCWLSLWWWWADLGVGSSSFSIYYTLAGLGRLLLSISRIPLEVKTARIFCLFSIQVESSSSIQYWLAATRLWLDLSQNYVAGQKIIVQRRRSIKEEKYKLSKTLAGLVMEKFPLFLP